MFITMETSKFVNKLIYLSYQNYCWYKRILCKIFVLHDKYTKEITVILNVHLGRYITGFTVGN